MTTIKIMTLGDLPKQAMDVAISVAADVLHLWPSMDGYDAMAGQRDIIPDSQIMAQVPEYSRHQNQNTADKDDKPSRETEDRFRKTGWKPVEQTYWAVNLVADHHHPVRGAAQDKVWKEMNITSTARNAPWTRYYETGVVDWNEVATMAMYPFKPGELMSGPVHYGKRYDNLQRILGRLLKPASLNLYHVVMMYPNPQQVVTYESRDNVGRVEWKEKGFVAVWPFGKNGMENNDMAFLDLEEGNIKMLFGENAYAAWIEERGKMSGHYESINRQTIS